jgi:hypothetical protein
LFNGANLGLPLGDEEKNVFAFIAIIGKLKALKR